jgi:alkanesulfonate monooxygenase SsuD/methylene tetrahydromethanopterin reductase-like flavin-dependent oxidoreductase (luciferase family)
MTTFGLYAAIGDPPRGERLQQCIDEVCAEAQLAEQVGFEAILVGEHHQHRDGFLPSPLIVSTAVAARTQKIRIGTEAECTIEKMAPDRIFVGSPAEVVDRLQRWQATTAAEMVIFRLCQAHSGGPPHEKILRAIRLFGEKVIPKLA